MDKTLLLLDDGKFCIERNSNMREETANGFLLRRCATGLTTPGGYECVGGYERRLDGTWGASIDAPYDSESDSDSRELGTFNSNLEAITALWAARYEAYHSHA